MTKVVHSMYRFLKELKKVKFFVNATSANFHIFKFPPVYVAPVSIMRPSIEWTRL